MVEIAAVFIASLALVLTIQQGIETRRHARLTLKPSLSITITTGNNRKYYGITLNSVGVGPAIFKSRIITFDGAIVSSWKNLIVEIERKGLTFWNPSELAENVLWGELYIDEFLPPEHKQRLLWIDHNEIANKTKLLVTLSKLHLLINYESVYGEKYFLEWNGNEQLSPD